MKNIYGISLTLGNLAQRVRLARSSDCINISYFSLAFCRAGFGWLPRSSPWQRKGKDQGVAAGHRLRQTGEKDRGFGWLRDHLNSPDRRCIKSRRRRWRFCKVFYQNSPIFDGGDGGVEKEMDEHLGVDSQSWSESSH